jgi:hypothetical protein
MKRLALLVAAAFGYVLGSRAGRGPYEKFSARSKGVWQDPRVQGRVRQATSLGWYRPGEGDPDVTLVTDAAEARDVSASR